MTTATSPLVPGDTERIRIYQADAGLVVDGILGPMTRASLIADERRDRTTAYAGTKPSFGLTIRCEGHVGVPYVPGGPDTKAGVTIGYGWDLRHQYWDELQRIWSGVWAQPLLEELRTAIGLQGLAAAAWLNAHGAARWSFTIEQAAERLPAQAERYWLAALREWPELAFAPPRVQTATLSATYSLWLTGTRAVRDGSRQPNWRTAAAALAGLGGTKSRRELEASLIEGAGQ